MFYPLGQHRTVYVLSTIRAGQTTGMSIRKGHLDKAVIEWGHCGVLTLFLLNNE